MPKSPSDFWPDDIFLGALSPAMILNQQAEALSQRTKGLIQAELMQSKSGNMVRLYFDLISHAARYRYRILSILYAESKVYPAVITAPTKMAFPNINVKPATSWGVTQDEADRSRIAYSPADFEKLLRLILNSPSVKSSILSMIARSNETISPPKIVDLNPPVLDEDKEETQVDSTRAQESEMESPSGSNEDSESEDDQPADSRKDEDAEAG